MWKLWMGNNLLSSLEVNSEEIIGSHIDKKIAIPSRNWVFAMPIFDRGIWLLLNSKVFLKRKLSTKGKIFGWGLLFIFQFVPIRINLATFQIQFWDKISNFQLNFYQEFYKFTRKYNNQLCFRPNARKFNALFLNCFEKLS